MPRAQALAGQSFPWRAAAAAIGAVLLGLLGCAAGGARQELTRAEYEQQWQYSEQDLKAARSAEVYQARLALIESPLFEGLPEEQRHARLLSTGWLGIEQKNFAGAHQLLVRSSGMAGEGAEDWGGRLFAAFDLADLDDATLALTRLAQDWPSRLTGVPSAIVLRTALREAVSQEQQAARFELRLALYHASFKLEYGLAPGGLWGELALDLLQRGRVEEARDIIPSIDAPRAILAMRIDKRFDDLVRLSPTLFDVQAAAQRHIKDYEEAAWRFPRKLDAAVQLSYAYLDAGRYVEARRVAIAALCRDAKAAAYEDDAETALNWLLDNYARAAVALGKRSEAETALELARLGTENGQMNVSNVINLGAFYADLGQPDKALRVLAEIGVDDSDTLLSPYGRMLFHGVRQAAAIAKGDARLANRELEYLRAHQTDAIGAYQEALLRAGRLEEAAQLLIARLRDPARSRAALSEIQIYSDPPSLPGAVQLRERRRTVADRPDVRQAVDQIGRIESFPVPPGS